MALLDSIPAVTKLEQAVSLLNNHIPGYGAQPTESSAIVDAGTFMDEVPPLVVAELTMALVAAAKYVRKTFEGV